MSKPVKTTFTSEELTQAFEILLGEPLTNFDTDSTYAAFFCDTPETSLLEVLTPENLTGAPISDEAQRDLDAMSKETGGNAGRKYDLARSLFTFYEEEFYDSDPDEGEADLLAPCDFSMFKAVSLSCSMDYYAILSGQAVAGLAPAGVNLSEYDRNAFWMSDTVLRMNSDGTLLDAMAVATGTHGEITPRTFNSMRFATSPDEDWVEPLSRINNSILREHISTFCLNYGDARCAFWRFAGSRKNFQAVCGKLSKFWAMFWVKELGWEQIAKWEITDGPGAELVIMRIPPGKETPMTPR